MTRQTAALKSPDARCLHDYDDGVANRDDISALEQRTRDALAAVLCSLDVHNKARGAPSSHDDQILAFQDRHELRLLNPASGHTSIPRTACSCSCSWYAVV